MKLTTISIEISMFLAFNIKNNDLVFSANALRIKIQWYENKIERYKLIFVNTVRVAIDKGWWVQLCAERVEGLSGIGMYLITRDAELRPVQCRMKDGLVPARRCNIDKVWWVKHCAVQDEGLSGIGGVNIGQGMVF